jgi:hypothetical protein
MLPQRILLAATCVGLPLPIGGCVADLFGDRAASYNQEAAINKDRTILTNIVRASLGRPLQYTDLTTISGTASQSLSLAGVIPFAVHRPTTVGAQATFMPSVSLSGGPTFSVANLSTKEFYSGILTPIEMKLVDYYWAQGDYIPRVLLSLVISEIDFPGERFPNSVEKYPDFQSFQSVLNGLLAAGLKIEALDKQIAESPVLSERDAKDPKLLASLASGAAAGNTTLDLKRYEVTDPIASNKDPNLVKSEYNSLKQNGNLIYFRLEKKNPNPRYRFCFDRAEIEKAQGSTKLTFPLHYSLRWLVDGKMKRETIDVSEANLCSATAPGQPSTPDTTQKVSENVTVKTRSVEEIIMFLGEIVREQAPPRPQLRVLETPGSLVGARVLFSASEEPPPGPSISATVDGHTFYVEVDATGKNMSSRVIQLLAELIALHNSAKDLPAPNVITVISP